MKIDKIQLRKNKESLSFIIIIFLIFSRKKAIIYIDIDSVSM